MMAEHPNVDVILLSTPVNYFCVAISKATRKENFWSPSFVSSRSVWGGSQFCARLSGWFSSHDRVLTLLISVVMAGYVSAADAWLL